MTKSEARKIYKSKRSALSVDECEQLSRQICQQFLDSKYIQYQVFHIFLPILNQKEINTYLIVDELKKRNKTIVVPKMDGSNLLSFELKPETILKENAWQIPEPQNGQLFPTEQIEVVLTPLLICDKNLNRIGYGKGFYDQFFIQCSSNVQRIGINYFPPIDKIDNVDKTDIPLTDLIIA